MFEGMFTRELVNYATGETRIGPGYLELLDDAARNRTRLGDGGGRRRYAGNRLATYTDPRPAELGGTVGQRVFEHDLNNGRMALGCILADGRINLRASALRARARFTMLRWGNPRLLAASPEAKECFLEMEALIKDIERCINRPIDPTPCGPCPTLTAPDQECGWALEAYPHDIEVTCGACGLTYNVERLRESHLASIGHRRYTRRDLLTLLERIGEPVPKQTMSDWIRTGKLKCRGYQRPTEPGKIIRMTLTRQSEKDKPVFRLEDARALRRSKAETNQ